MGIKIEYENTVSFLNNPLSWVLSVFHIQYVAVYLKFKTKKGTSPQSTSVFLHLFIHPSIHAFVYLFCVLPDSRRGTSFLILVLQRRGNFRYTDPLLFVYAHKNLFIFTTDNIPTNALPYPRKSQCTSPRKPNSNPTQPCVCF